VPDTRHHRGPDPEDARLFAPEQWPVLLQATDDLCWLLDRRYAIRSAVELVGNRYSLAVRQRLAVARSACSQAASAARKGRELMPSDMAGLELWLDGLNVLTGLEVALSGGFVLIGRDGCCRDVAGVHRHYRKVEETIPALELAGATLAQWGVTRCCWWLDKPVSNSGRLKSILIDAAARNGWRWQVELVNSPDAVLARTDQVVATADSAILDRCQRWVNLLRWILQDHVPPARLIDLSHPADNTLP
jgi:hypothetical protein